MFVYMIVPTPVQKYSSVYRGLPFLDGVLFLRMGESLIVLARRKNREPTVLDYVKSLLRGKPLEIPEAQETPEIPQQFRVQPQEQPQEAIDQATPEGILEQRVTRVNFPWRALLALGIALAAQISLMPRPNRAWLPGVILYLCAAVVLAWSIWKGEWLPRNA
jgi:hypothetical protein